MSALDEAMDMSLHHALLSSSYMEIVATDVVETAQCSVSLETSLEIPEVEVFS